MSDNFSWASPAAAEGLVSRDEEDESTSEVKCSFLTGEAGCGKTYTVKQEIAEDPTAGILCATTGISAVNLGTITINSLLKYYDTSSLRESFIRGRLTRLLAELAVHYKSIIIDEVPMMSGEQLDILYQGCLQANDYEKVKKSKNPGGLAIRAVGDFLQLPPIKSKWAFEADCWPEFEKDIVRLTHNYRQGEGDFLKGINAIRRGEGDLGAELLSAAGVEFASMNMIDFPGTTILAKNIDVDRFNWVALSKLDTEQVKVASERWIHPSGRPPGEWKLIPEELGLKIGAYVMILANDSPSFSYANGDCGWVEGYDPTVKVFTVRLVRNNSVVHIPMIERRVTSNFDPKNDEGEVTELHYGKREQLQGMSRPWNEPYFDEVLDKFVIGAVKFSPLKLAYASTVHKSQGLTLDRVQMDIRGAFFGNPAMAYVAISRCRTAVGLRIVGDKKLLGKRVKVAEEVKKWL